jgi:hypothetical protein
MPEKSVEIIIHIDESLSEEYLSQLEKHLCEDYGISNASISPKHQHLMLVDYLPDSINSMQVLTYVKNKGIHAELIGGI